jgi:3-oxoacyl-[acyl-carrier protein] reductase
MGSEGFEGRVALVTGAGRGIGRAIAERFAHDGCSVVINDLDAGVAAEVVDAIIAAGGQAVVAAGSVADPEATDAMASVAEEAFGGLDIVVNNAGLTADAWLHRMSDDTWDRVLDVCLDGTKNVCRSAAPLLRRPKDDPPAYHRKVVNIASVNGIYGTAGNVNYSAAKAGVIGLSRALAREWAQQKINVNVIAPGYIKGTRLTAPRDDNEEQFGLQPEMIPMIEDQIPIGRPGIPDDVAAVASFLASSDSDYVTCQVIEVHGGLEIIKVV